MDTISLLRRAELFRDLSEDQLAQIAAISDERRFSRDDVIFEQGSTGDGMYLVCDGQVEVRVRDSEGNTFAALYLGVGQVFGEMALVDEGRVQLP
ncbi:cyclic nucleotide-binding domain-containing protein [bacterium]|nr:cyclic nucleotide-binding domain-containing protein [bacterium]